MVRGHDQQAWVGQCVSCDSRVLKISLFVPVSSKTARYNAGWMKMRIIMTSAGTTSLPCFPYRGQLAHGLSADRLADSSVRVFCSPQPSFFYLNLFVCDNIFQMQWSCYPVTDWEKNVFN